MKKQGTFFPFSRKFPMEKLVEECLKINNTRFPVVINDLSYNSLTDFVHKVSHKYLIPFAAQNTEKYRKTFIYTCTFNTYGCQSKLVFSKFTDFNDNEYFSFSLQDSVLIHYNHPLDKHFVEAHRNCYSNETCNQIKFQSELGVLPGRIRTNLGIECGSNLFYDIRRQVIQNEKKEDLDSLIDTLRNGHQKRVKVNDPDGILNSITIIDDEVISSSYSTDIAIIDDTAMTNVYGLPLETIVVVDQENHTQLLGYSILTDKSEQSFSNFIKDYVSLGGLPFRIIVVDRLEAQYDAFIKEFPNTFIVFCLVHIRRDLVSHFGSNDPIISGFDNAKQNPASSFQYLNYLMHRRTNLSNSKGKKCLDLLIERYEHWLPICLIQHGMYLSFSSSRIEGLFGLFKGNYGHDRGKIVTVIKSLNNLCAVLKTQSYSTYSKTYKEFCNLPLIPPDHYKMFGRLILEILQNEYNAMILGRIYEPCVWCCLRQMNSSLSIPCRHTITYGFRFDINQIHQRFLRSINITNNLPNSVFVDETANQIIKNRKNFLSRIDLYLNYYGKNEKVDSILEKTLQDLDNLKVFPNKGMPPTIAQSGRAFTHPSHNVFAGRQKTKRNYTCSTCHQSGHNAQNCPYKDIHT